ncbi:MAG: transposase domain-containing protein, partial [Opitutaceae bacterium]|jgi:hypothetical protein|nr:transposase domain-containing protein [Opitutaceae bacterium]
MVYYVMAMCIHSQIGVVEVLRWLLEEARGLFGHGELAVATSGAISSARARLGSGVLEALYRRIVGPVALKRTRGAWHGELRVVALDGSTLELQDSPEIARHYGYAAVGRGEPAFPKLRFAALVETGTRARRMGSARRMGQDGWGQAERCDILKLDERHNLLENHGDGQISFRCLVTAFGLTPFALLNKRTPRFPLSPSRARLHWNL